jgi:hypothetical protein
MTPTRIEDRVRRHAWPEPSPELRARVTAIATVSREQLTWSDRLWFSRAWRLSAIATVIVTIALEYFSGSPAASRSLTPSLTQDSAQAFVDAGRQLGLPADVTALLARRALSEAPRMRAAPLPELAFEGERR